LPNGDFGQNGGGYAKLCHHLRNPELREISHHIGT
jgi:hypothetical protein